MKINLKLLIMSALFLTTNAIFAVKQPSSMVGSTVSDIYYECAPSVNVKKFDNRCTRLPGKNSKIVVCKYRAGTRPPFIGVKACKPIQFDKFQIKNPKPNAKKAPVKKIVTPANPIKPAASGNIAQTPPIFGAGPTTTMNFNCDLSIANIPTLDNRCQRVGNTTDVTCQYKVGTTPPLLGVIGCINKDAVTYPGSTQLNPIETTSTQTGECNTDADCGAGIICIYPRTGPVRSSIKRCVDPKELKCCD